MSDLVRWVTMAIVAMSIKSWDSKNSLLCWFDQWLKVGLWFGLFLLLPFLLWSYFHCFCARPAHSGSMGLPSLLSTILNVGRSFNEIGHSLLALSHWHTHTHTHSLSRSLSLHPGPSYYLITGNSNGRAKGTEVRSSLNLYEFALP